MILRKFESLRKRWNVLFVHIGYGMYMCLCTLRSTMFEYLFSVNIMRQWWKCKQPVENNSVLHNYKRWRSQITLKWEYSHPLNLFSQIPSGLIICLISFFYTKTTDKMIENYVQYSRCFLFFVWAWYSWKKFMKWK